MLMLMIRRGIAGGEQNLKLLILFVLFVETVSR